jgi:hypothetical protein
MRTDLHVISGDSAGTLATSDDAAASSRTTMRDRLRLCIALGLMLAVFADFAFGQVASIASNADARAVYVSETRGSDSNPGTLDSPRRTFVATFKALGWRTAPHTVYLFAGERYTQSIAGEYGTLGIAGPSWDAPLRIVVHGDGARPIVQPPANRNGLEVMGTPGAVLVEGIEFRAAARGAGGVGVRRFGEGLGIKLVDCVVADFGTNVAIEGERTGLVGGGLDRCIIVDATPGERGHSQGVYLTRTVDYHVRESLIDNNGRTVAGEGTIYNHNFYIQPDNKGTVIEDSIVTNASATGIQARAGDVWAVNNFVAFNPLNISAGHAEAREKTFTGVFLANVVYGSRPIASTLGPRGWGISTHKLEHAQIVGNIVIAAESMNVAFYREANTWSKAARFENNAVVGFEGQRKGVLMLSAGDDEWFGLHEHARPLITPVVDVPRIIATQRARQRGEWIESTSAAAVNTRIRRTMPREGEE